MVPPTVNSGKEISEDSADCTNYETKKEFLLQQPRSFWLISCKLLNFLFCVICSLLILLLYYLSSFSSIIFASILSSFYTLFSFLPSSILPLCFALSFPFHIFLLQILTHSLFIPLLLLSLYSLLYPISSCPHPVPSRPQVSVQGVWTQYGNHGNWLGQIRCTTLLC